MTIFFAKRMLAVFVLCAIPMWGDYLFMAGFLLGCAAALCKVRLWGNLTKEFPWKMTPVLAPLLSFAVLIITVAVGPSLFIGCAAGMLSLPLVVVVNAVTEKAGISRNQWK